MSLEIPATKFKKTKQDITATLIGTACLRGWRVGKSKLWAL